MQNDSWENQYLKKIYEGARQSSLKKKDARVEPSIKLPKKKGSLSGLISLFVVLAILAATLGFAASIFSRFILFETLLTLLPGEKLLSETNILVLGLDEGKLSHRSDTLMLVHIDPVNDVAQVVAIPRDTIVYIPGRGLDKVNHAYAYGGAELAKKTIENFLNINVPYYVSIDLDGVSKIIDEFGGVTIDVERRMYYVDKSQNLFVNLRPGVQKLSGKDALGYLRYRQHGGDIGRILRQQKFIKAMASQLGHRENILRSPQLVIKLFSHMDTNLNTREILGLALSMRKIYDMGSIKMSQVPGFDIMIDGVYYLKPDSEALSKLVKEIKKGS